MNAIKKWLKKMIKSQLHKSALESYYGIDICDINCNDSDDKDFLKITKRSIDFIKNVDENIFNRVKRELKFIVNTELTSIGRFNKEFKCCYIDFGRYNFLDYYDWCFFLYATTIVHEATHGYLFSKGIKYNRRTRIRVERICHNEEVRFLKKINCPFARQLLGEFKAQNWNFSWSASRWDRLKVLFKRIKESRQLNKQALQAM